MNIVIIGANSAIATAMARRYAERHDALFLTGRDETRLRTLAEELRDRGADLVDTRVLDVTRREEHEEAVRAAVASLGNIDVAILCHGMLTRQEDCENDFTLAEKELDVNGLSVISLLTRLRPVFQGQGRGTLAVITSVAGDRGRQPTYIYGAAKSMVSTYLQGLRGKLYPHGVHVVDIRPGPVDTPMTAHLQKGLLFSSPEKVAACAVRGIDRRRHTVYAPAYWRAVMLVVRMIPETLFKRLNF